MEKDIHCLDVACYPLERSVHPKTHKIDPNELNNYILGDLDHSATLILKLK